MDNFFKIKYLKTTENEIEKIGFDKSYIKKAAEKHKFTSIKIYNLSCAQANIIKQTALSTGTDCAVHRETITGKVEKSDCILSGSISELKKISKKLSHQPLKLSELGANILNLLENRLVPIKIRQTIFSWEKPYLMGILNITPDSFSDGGCHNTLEKAIEHFKKLVHDGADIIDIGGESTRPFANEVTPEEEQKRVIPVIKAIREFDTSTIISIDTRNSTTAQKAIEEGADIINDISSGDWDENMFKIAQKYNAPIILNHSSATPDIMQDCTDYEDLTEDIFEYFSKKIKTLTDIGFDRKKIIIDPGFGFGKTTAQNFEILTKLEEFKSLNCPILAGHSRKNFIKETIKTDDIEMLDTATAVISEKLIQNGADILRVHNVEKNKVVIDLFLINRQLQKTY